MKNKTDELPCEELMFADWRSQPVSLASFEPLVGPKGMRQLLAGLGDVFHGLSHVWFQADDQIKPPPKKIGEYHDPDYGRDGKGGFERTKDGKKAACGVTVYVEYGVAYKLPIDSCDKVTALQIMALMSQVENDALEKAPAVCKSESKECPNADVLIVYVEWFCGVREVEEEEDKGGKKEKVKVNRAVLGIRVQVKVTCKP